MSELVVDARPTPVSLDVGRAALVVVDMQNDFGSAGGMFDRAGIDISGIQALIEPIGTVLDTARAAGIRVVYLKMAFQADLSDADPSSPIWIKHLPMHAGEPVHSPGGEPSRILIRDTWNTDIVDALAPQPGDVVVYKSRYGGFHGTELEATLRREAIDTLIFVGATTSVCLDTTVREAVARDFHAVVLEDCVTEPIGADLEPSGHDSTLRVLELLFASISSAASFVSALRGTLSGV